MKDNRQIRKAEAQDLQIVLGLIDSGRKIMMASGNIQQWDATYPSRQQVEEDIANGVSYLVTEKGTPIATFAFMPGPEPTYNIIYEGHWLNDNPYNIRIDTHRDNNIMRHCLEKYGFTYCGIIHLGNGDDRVAYQQTL